MGTSHTTARLLVGIVTVLVATAAIGAPVAGSLGSQAADRSVSEPSPTEKSASLLQSATRDQFEPNDDFDNASQIGPGTYGGLGITENDTDIYAVDVESGAALSTSTA